MLFHEKWHIYANCINEACYGKSPLCAFIHFWAEGDLCNQTQHFIQDTKDHLPVGSGHLKRYAL